MMDTKKENLYKEHKEVVKTWWENPRNMRWNSFYNDEGPNQFRMLGRQGRVLAYLDGLHLAKGSKVLELGFGAGQTALRILERGFHYTGIDISQQLCDAAVKRCYDYVEREQAKFFVGNIEEQLPFEEGSFDAIIVVGALQYLSFPDRCLKEVNRLLKGEGHFIVAQTNIFGLKQSSTMRGCLLNMIYALMSEEYEIFPFSYKSMLLNTKLRKYFKKHENASWMNTKFMLNGHEERKFNIKKRINSYWRLKKLLKRNNFKIMKKDGEPFFWSNSGRYINAFRRINNICQWLADGHLIPFFFALGDSVVLLGKKGDKP